MAETRADARGGAGDYGRWLWIGLGGASVLAGALLPLLAVEPKWPWAATLGLCRGLWVVVGRRRQVGARFDRGRGR
jgi:hypothetical protein